MGINSKEIDYRARYEFLMDFLQEHGILSEKFCKPVPTEPYDDYWILHIPQRLQLKTPIKYALSPDELIEKLMKDNTNANS